MKNPAATLAEIQGFHPSLQSKSLDALALCLGQLRRSLFYMD